MASICGATEGSFVERVASILPQGLKDSWRLAERQPPNQPAGGSEASLMMESVTVPGVSYGEAGSGEDTLKYTFALHCPTLFRRIRARYGIRDEDFKLSLCTHRSIKGGVIGGDQNSEDVDGSNSSDHVSGSVFFFSRDRKFALKSLREYEFDLLRFQSIIFVFCFCSFELNRIRHLQSHKEIVEHTLNNRFHLVMLTLSPGASFPIIWTTWKTITRTHFFLASSHLGACGWKENLHCFSRWNEIL
jgi:hypothetical protein